MMTRFLSNTTLSLRIATVAFVIWTLDAFTRGGLRWWLELRPERVLSHAEIWRIVAYPLVFPDVFSLAMFVVALLLFGSALEQIWRPKRLAVFFLSIILAQGIIWLFIPFSGRAPALCGAASLTFFVLSSSFWLYQKRFIMLLGRYYYSIHAQATIFTLLMLSLSVIGYAAIIGDQNTFLQGSFQSMLGVVAGLGSTFFYTRKNAPKQELIIEPAEIIAAVKDPERVFSAAPYIMQSQAAQTSVHHYDEILSDEDHLNLILDAIFERGYDSIPPEEKEFLERYSKNL